MDQYKIKKGPYNFSYSPLIVIIFYYLKIPPNKLAKRLPPSAPFFYFQPKSDRSSPKNILQSTYTYKKSLLLLKTKGIDYFCKNRVNYLAVLLAKRKPIILPLLEALRLKTLPPISQ